MCTVLSGGSSCETISRSEKPATETSSGTRRPSSVALAERTDGERVRRAIDRGQLRVRGEQCPCRAAALDDGLRRHLHDMPRGGRDAATIEAVEDPRQSRRDPVIEAGRGGDDAEVAMPEIDQVAQSG